MTTTGDADTDVEAGELVETDDEQGLVDLDRQTVSRPILQLNTTVAVGPPSSSCPCAASSFTEAFSLPSPSSSTTVGPSSKGSSFRSSSYLGSENGRLNELQRAAVDLDQTLSGLGVGDSLSIPSKSQHFL